MAIETRHSQIDRRRLLAGATALGVAPIFARSTAFGASPGSQIPIADLHYHLFFGVGRRPAHTQPIGANMTRGNATLVSWSLVGDMPWLALSGAGSFNQKGKPAKGEATAWLKDEVGRVKAHLSDQKIALVRTPADIAAAANGRPHVLISVEGATFADDGLKQLQTAHDLGVRQIQLVHFIENTIGDMQTEPPTHKGLSGFGREVVAECNRLGILIDLAHCTEAAVRHVLDKSKAPVVWSHSSVSNWKIRLPSFAAWRARQLSQSAAKDIAAAGGVIGIWALGNDVGATPQSYADRVHEVADLIGEDHVAFGTDMNALSQPAVSTFTDLRASVSHMLQRKVPEARVRKIAFGNVARVMTTAMRGFR